jgi:hypothetical protein
VLLTAGLEGGLPPDIDADDDDDADASTSLVVSAPLLVAGRCVC